MVTALGTTNGLTPSPVATLAGQFLPDVMRISTNDAHYAYAMVANAARTGNSLQQEVAYASCVSATSGAPVLCGGRKIRDDVIDITLTYIAGGNPNPAALGAVPAYTINDGVVYAPSHPGALLATFPFLAVPQ